MRNLRQHFAIVAIGLTFAMVIGCGEQESFGSDSASGSGSDPEPTATATTAESAASTPTALGPDAALRQDAKMYADDYGISVDEAVERLDRQGELGRLGAAIEANERDTFAGAFIEHEPEYRFVVLFTRDGEETIRKYVDEGSELAEIVEVGTAHYTMAKLQEAQREAIDLVRQVDTRVSSGINVWENQVEFYVFDAEEFQGRLDDADIVLPEGVALVEEGDAPEIAVDPTPVPGIYFPVEKPSPGPRVSMAALIIGELVLDDGCLRIRNAHTVSSNLPIWPPDHRLRADGDVVEVVNGDGDVVARVGEEVSMGGGESGWTDPAELSEYLREPIPDNCSGPYWIVGDTSPLDEQPAVPTPWGGAPLLLNTVPWPSDAAGIEALLAAMPGQLVDLDLDPWDGPIDTERITVGYGPQDELGQPRFTIIDLTTGSFFPADWTVGDVMASSFTSDDGTTVESYEDLIWAIGETSESRSGEPPEETVPLHTITWGREDSTWLFAAAASDPTLLDQLVASVVTAAGSE